MSRTLRKPVVLLTFANASEHGYLQQLKKESARLRDLFLPLQEQGRIELVREESLDLTELPELLNRYKDRIVLFHYAGHADEAHLALEDGVGRANGLAELLRLQKGLQLVFLNGCSTQAQVRSYLAAGIPVVIATTRAISDDQATLFAAHFYHALLHRHTIGEAFQSANGVLLTRTSLEKPEAAAIVPVRSLDESTWAWTEDIPWRLYVQDERQEVLGRGLEELIGQADSYPPADRPAGEKPRHRAWRWLVAAGVVIALLAGLAELSGFTLRELFGGGSAVDSFSATVLVHGKAGRDDRILRNAGEVVLDFGSTRTEAAIDDEGEATFKEIPIGYAGQTVRISIDHPQPYFPTDRTAEYVLAANEAIYLEVALTGTDRVQGRVLGFQSEDPLDSVRVSYRDIATHTDAFGWYELNIPPEQQAKFIRLTFYKPGYQMLSIDSIAPHTGQEVSILLEKRQE